MIKSFRVLPCGDAALSVEFENKISEEVHSQVSLLAGLIGDAQIKGIRELIPTYRAVMVSYDPLIIEYHSLEQRIYQLAEGAGSQVQQEKRVVEIPVCYGGTYGPDLESVANYHHLSPEEVVRIHSEPEYLIYMLGFTPGFPYLGGMDKRIATPRLPEPRTKIKGGSVGIAGEQTGLYPIDSPGGWQLIGRTPLKLYDPGRNVPILLKASQYIRFYPITPEEYQRIEQQIEENSYEYPVS